MRHAVDLKEFADHLRTECIARSTGRQGEFIPFGVGIGPNQIGHGAFVRDFAEPVDDFDLVDGVDGRGKATMYAEDLVIDDHA